MFCANDVKDEVKIYIVNAESAGNTNWLNLATINTTNLITEVQSAV